MASIFMGFPPALPRVVDERQRFVYNQSKTVEKRVFRQDNIRAACLPAVDTCPDQGIFSAVHAAGKNVI